MRAHLFMAACALLAVSTAAAADDVRKTVHVPFGHRVHVTARAASDGDSNTTEWVILRDGASIVGVNVQPGTRASTEVDIGPGRHLLIAHCDDHLGRMRSCTITTVP
ncbi:MAG: hypothetical protein QOJ94_2334 [Sphingomonadales bacterium]|jgi:hypothetical protein|nr:hypothetical protein [Sphingomonadales bacterium]